MTRLPAHRAPPGGLCPAAPARPATPPAVPRSARRVPGARTPRAAFPILRRSPRPGPNMLDGLKMEENFPGAMETAAPFSSLLGECSGLAPSRPALGWAQRCSQLAGTHWAPGEPAPASYPQLGAVSPPAPRCLLLQTDRGLGLAARTAVRTAAARGRLSDKCFTASGAGFFISELMDVSPTPPAPRRPGAEAGAQGPGGSRTHRPQPRLGLRPDDRLFRAGGQRSRD